MLIVAKSMHGKVGTVNTKAKDAKPVECNVCHKTFNKNGNMKRRAHLDLEKDMYEKVCIGYKQKTMTEYV